MTVQLSAMAANLSDQTASSTHVGVATAAPAKSADRTFAGLCLAGCAAAVGIAVHLGDGDIDPPEMHTIFWLKLALILAFTGVAASRVKLLDRLGTAPAAALISILLFLQVQLIINAPARFYLGTGRQTDTLIFNAAIVTAVAAAIGAIVKNGRVRIVCVPIMLAAILLAGILQIRHDPAPYIDVFTVQQEGSQALLDDKSPYAIQTTDIYHGNPKFETPGTSVDGKNPTGYPYLPLSLLMALPGYLFAGDHRYSQLFALVAAGGLIAFLRPGRLAPAAAALLLLSPRVMYVIESGWTEPFAILMLAVVVLCAIRKHPFTPFALGLLFAIKQNMIVGSPLVLLLIPRPWKPAALFDWTWKMLASAAIVTLPLVLWNWPAFKASVLGISGLQSLHRVDALSFVTWWWYRTGNWLPDWLPFAAILPTIGLAIWKAPRTPASFAAATGLVQLTLFAFSKHAFCNHYFFVIGAMCCAVAAGSVAHPSEQSLVPD